ncbi:hypothetical protein AVEN_203897-1 [Araneus ventricosus]|uniref:Uncharacterized protein n=1 Tax=Araneus ventricosus TaxID=182803 RepID=A0A4Y2T1U4_ARAVE|nr:hypothetical protein AVEN_203897-1 [Araneus ventricosus]
MVRETRIKNRSDNTSLRNSCLDGTFSRKFSMDGDSEFSIFEELIYDSDEIVWEVKFNELEKQTIMPYNIKCSLDLQENTSSIELDVEAFGDCVIYSK